MTVRSASRRGGGSGRRTRLAFIMFWRMIDASDCTLRLLASSFLGATRWAPLNADVVDGFGAVAVSGGFATGTRRAEAIFRCGPADVGLFIRTGPLAFASPARLSISLTLLSLLSRWAVGRICVFRAKLAAALLLRRRGTRRTRCPRPAARCDSHWAWSRGGRWMRWSWYTGSRECGRMG